MEVGVESAGRTKIPPQIMCLLKGYLPNEWARICLLLIRVDLILFSFEVCYLQKPPNLQFITLSEDTFKASCPLKIPGLPGLVGCLLTLSWKFCAKLGRSDGSIICHLLSSWQIWRF